MTSGLDASSDRHERMVAALIDAASEGILVIDITGGITLANRRAEVLFGYGSGELLGVTVEQLMVEELRVIHRAHREAFFAAPFVRPMGVALNLTGLRRDGRSFPIEVGLGVVELNDAKLALAMITDITARKRAEDALMEARRAAESANWAKSLFLAGTSHDLRTPIHAIIGTAELLAQVVDSDEQRGLIALLDDSARLLLGIIDGVLDLSAIEGGRLALHGDPFALRESIEVLIRAQRRAAEARHLELRYDCDDGVPAVVVGDAGRVNQILLNLLTNSIRYTEQGEIRVAVEARERRGANVVIDFTVSDTGPGIPAALQEQIFQPFTRASRGRADGTGLGLAVARHLARLMGGDVMVHSEPGFGSTFRARIPFTVTSAESASWVQEREPSTERSLRILIADDNRASRIVARGMLGRMGHEVTSVESGEEAVDAVGRDTYALVLMDLQMPTMDGLDAIAEIRRKEQSTGRRLPIVVVTAEVLAGEKERCLAAGADGYLSKPFRSGELEEVIGRMVGSR